MATCMPSLCAWRVRDVKKLMSRKSADRSREMTASGVMRNAKEWMDNTVRSKSHTKHRMPTSLSAVKAGAKPAMVGDGNKAGVGYATAAGPEGTTTDRESPRGPTSGGRDPTEAAAAWCAADGPDVVVWGD